jgi:hypothetical protein
MIKNEQLRDINQRMRTIPTAPTVSLQPPLPPPPPAPMLQTTSGFLSQRLLDSNAIDITSLKGQFAWEKIPNTDTYMPVIFRYVNNEHTSSEFPSIAHVFTLYDFNKLKKEKVHCSAQLNKHTQIMMRKKCFFLVSARNLCKNMLNALFYFYKVSHFS